MAYEPSLKVTQLPTTILSAMRSGRWSSTTVKYSLPAALAAEAARAAALNMAVWRRGNLAYRSTDGTRTHRPGAARRRGTVRSGGRALVEAVAAVAVVAVAVVA
eukprot:2914628-Prymnesium_polylepis.1